MSNERTTPRAPQGCSPDPLPPAPFHLRFDGLFLFCFDRGAGGPTRCHIGVATHAPRHIQLLSITKIRDGLEGEPVTLALDSSTLRSIRQVNISFTNGDPARPREHCVREGFNRETDGDNEDFRWVLDFEESNLHHRGVGRKRANVLVPVITIRGGLFFTDTRDSVHHSFKRNRETEFRPFGRVAETVGVNVYADDPARAVTMRVRIKFTQGPPLDQELTAEPGDEYVVHLLNVCPPFLADTALNSEGSELACALIEAGRVELERRRRDPPRDPREEREHEPCFDSDITFYYDAFEEIPYTEAFDFQPTEDVAGPVAPSPLPGVRPLICYSARLSQSDSLPGGE